MVYNRVRKYVKRASRNKMDPIFGAPARVASLAKDVKMLKGVINSEKKYKDFALTANIDATTPQIFCVTPVSQGQDNDQRIGRSILAKSIYIKGYLSFEDDTLTAQGIRLMLVQDKQQNGVAPVLSAATDPDNGILEETATWSHLNMENSNRYRVLFDKTYQFSKDADRSVQRREFKKYIKLKHHIHYSGTAAAAGDLDIGNIFCVCFADANHATTSSSLRGTTRLRYYDN